MTTTIEKKDRVRWYFDPEARTASVTIGDNSEIFDLSKVIPMDATMNVKALGFYGFKQWIASNWASFKDDTGKFTSAKEDYDDLVSAGLEITQGEKGITYVKIVGKTSVKGDRASVSKTHLNSVVWSLQELLTLQKAKVPFTPEMTKALMNLTDELNKQSELNALKKKAGK